MEFFAEEQNDELVDIDQLWAEEVIEALLYDDD